MENALKIIKIATLAIIVTICGGLMGWFVFLQSRQTTVKKIDQLTGATPTQQGTGAPFGSVLETNTNTSTTSQAVYASGSSNTSTHSIQKIWHIDPQPVAGMGFSSSSLMYVQRATGYIYNVDLVKQQSLRQADTLTPKIYEAYIAHDGSVAERIIDSRGAVRLFLGSIATTTPTLADATTTIKKIFTGSFSTPDTVLMALNTDTKQIVYTQPNAQSGTNLYLQSWDGTKYVLLTSLPTRDWVPSITPDGRIFVTQSPADGMEGYTYSVSAKGTLSTVLRNIPGLMTLPQPNGKGYLYSQSSAGNLSITIVASSTGRTIALSTIADKCVWAPNGNTVYCAVPKKLPSSTFINDWYRGIIHTNDEWWKIDTATSTRIYDPAGDNISFDVESPTIDQTGTYLIFKNRNDESLWSLNVSQ